MVSLGELSFSFLPVPIVVSVVYANPFPYDLIQVWVVTRVV